MIAGTAGALAASDMDMASFDCQTPDLTVTKECVGTGASTFDFIVNEHGFVRGGPLPSSPVSLQGVINLIRERHEVVQLQISRRLLEGGDVRNLIRFCY